MYRIRPRVPMAVVRRLPKYYRYLGDLMERGVGRISSKEFGRLLGFTASQIRQDLNYFGGFGQQGYGYNVEELREQIGKILGLDKKYNIIIVGAGNLGQAIANYTGFQESGFALKAMFDINPRLIGMSIRDVRIRDLDDIEGFMLEERIDIAVICTPKEAAQGVADRLVKAGIRAIWNFAPEDLEVPEDVVVENVHLSESLISLAYLANERETGGIGEEQRAERNNARA